MRTARNLFLVALLALPGIFYGAGAGAGEANLSLGYGVKWFDDDDWQSSATQGAAMIQTDYRPDTWWVGPALDILISHDEGEGSITVDSLEDALPDVIIREEMFEARPDGDKWIIDGYVETYVYEFSLGVRRVFGKPNGWRPYAGAGVTAIYARHDIELLGPNISDNDWGFGPWGQVGIRWQGHTYYIGVEARGSYAEIELYGQEYNAGGFTAAAVIGSSF